MFSVVLISPMYDELTTTLSYMMIWPFTCVTQEIFHLFEFLFHAPHLGHDMFRGFFRMQCVEFVRNGNNCCFHGEPWRPRCSTCISNLCPVPHLVVAWQLQPLKQLRFRAFGPRFVHCLLSCLLWCTTNFDGAGGGNVRCLRRHHMTLRLITLSLPLSTLGGLGLCSRRSHGIFGSHLHKTIILISQTIISLSKTIILLSKKWAIFNISMYCFVSLPLSAMFEVDTVHISKV